MARPVLTIDLDAIAANWSALDSQSGADVETGAVVKADAYGLGVSQVAPALYGAGARSFFVATAHEAAALRPMLPADALVYVFSGFMAGDNAAFDSAGILPLLNNRAQLHAFRRAHPSRPYGVQIDTGMARLGFEPAEWGALVFESPPIQPKLILSHLACADDPKNPMNPAQLGTFALMTAALPMVKKSLAATAGIILGAAYHQNLTRPGIGLYTGDFQGGRAVVTLDVPIIQTRTLLPGQPVGYGGTWTAPRPSRIATVAAGYADGIFRGTAGLVFYHGDTACPVVGRISMDMVAVDVTGLSAVPDTLRLFGPQQSVTDVAILAKTIPYEVLTSLGARYKRVYTGPQR